MKVAEIYRRLPLIFFTLVLAGLLWSRALLSIAEALTLLYGLIAFKRNKTIQYKHIIIWSVAPILLFFLGAYQQPWHWDTFDYLLTLAAYPAAALFMNSLDAAQQKQIMHIWIGAVLLSLLYPLGWYVLHMKEAALRYGMGQSLPTFMDTDHVRYGLFVCSGFLLLLSNSVFQKKWQYLFTVLLGCTIVFLSVRTAWVALIIILLFHFAGSIRWYYFFAAILLFALACFAAYEWIPTIHQKINYSIYDWQMYRSNSYTPDFSDGARRTINHIAWQTIREQHQYNVGWNEVPFILNSSFHRQYPTAQLNYGWPFNQYLFWWLGSGFWGMLLFVSWLMYPSLIFSKKKNKAALSWTLVIAASCFAESTLNFQYGVWLHGWVIALVFCIAYRSNVL
ncbi:MAG: O-antigen ligase family protein [Bacteroidota bacterium]|nr:O-antigen ligase family protein [Bacteroidota bacterium]